MSVATQPPDGAVESFAFRAWVRSTCRNAMVWGVGVLAVIGGVAWVFRSPDEGAFGRAFAVLSAYGLLFWVTLFKIWWTAGRPAVVLDDSTIGYQGLHAFRPRRIRFDRILACGMRAGTESLRFVIEGRRRDREFFLNLAVVEKRHRLLDSLGSRLEASGLENLAPGEASLKSNAKTRSSAPPKQSPSISATVTNGRDSIRAKSSCPRSAKSTAALLSNSTI